MLQVIGNPQTIPYMDFEGLGVPSTKHTKPVGPARAPPIQRRAALADALGQVGAVEVRALIQLEAQGEASAVTRSRELKKARKWR